jgi:murein DD-endopeptidase MepM/ murein hydrolase activator NlpD
MIVMTQFPKRHLVAVLCVTLLLVLLLGTSSNQASASRDSEWSPLELGTRYALALPPYGSGAVLAPANSSPFKHTTQTVRSGDSLARLFKKLGLSAKTLYTIDHLGAKANRLRKLIPGDTLHFHLDDAGQLQRLEYPYAATQTLVITATSSGFKVQEAVQEIETRTVFTRADITTNFWDAGIAAGLPASTVMELAGIFGWDIDFAIGIRSGDSFAVLYEQQYCDGQFLGDGPIIAAEFINQGERFQAARAADGNFYTPKGQAMRKTFLRAPVSFKYISSSFNPRRLHPVTGKVRPHNGIDYAAKPGTPIMAAGDGKVITSGYSAYNGNYIVIKHSSSYVTKYLHLQKRYVKKGQTVKQGKVIGTLGGTGRVTGPHLHYEFLVHGHHKNPRTVQLPDAQSLSGAAKAEFIRSAQPIFTKLDDNNRMLLALRS